jgi:predicted transglutaminase-like cysteine proteinase
MQQPRRPSRRRAMMSKPLSCSVWKPSLSRRASCRKNGATSRPRWLEISLWVAQCHANGICPVAAQRLIDISATGAGRSRRARVGLINRAADLAISPVADEAQWGAADHWSDPFETLLSNHGDCEDYAILKYAALLEAAIPKDDVKIVILKNFFPNENHAAVATRVDGEWLILDNRTLTLVRDTDVTRAISEFVLDHEGVKRFNRASQNRRANS